jgi:tetratricopeptide (TPR) repeat protein
MGHLGQHEKAVELLLKAIKEFPYEPLLYLYLARAYKNLGNWGAVKHWLKIGMELDLDEARSQMANILELKVLGAELMLEYYLYGQKNIRKAWEASRMLAKVHPTENNIKNEQFLYNQKELDLATEHAHKLLQYYMDIGREEMIAPTIETLPKEIKSLPFMIKLHNRYAKPRVWGEKEICYYASFGHPHFEKWNGNSLKSGIGGSETAVIKLSENWTQMGYKVTVFCDTPKPELINGVIYLPYIMFNPKDKFNIFIQWRHNSLAGKISVKKFLIDLHDIWWEDSYIEKIEGIDKIMVKSKYHRELGKGIIDEKFEIIGNGL